VVSGLTNGTSYTFSVVATNEIGDSVPPATSLSSVTPQSAASAPTTVTATAGDGQASVAFSGAVTNGSTISNYTVKAYDSNGNEVTGATCTTSTSPCTITGLANGSEYTFKVVTNSTVYGAGTTTPSLPSSSSNAIIPATAPDSPSGIEVTAGTGKISVSWDEPASNGSAIISYTVKAYDSAGNEVTGATCVATAPAKTCDVSANLVAGTSYTFKVTATSAAGTSAASAASTSVAVNAAPSVPINVIAEKGNTTATVRWDAPLDIRGSEITGYTVTAYSGTTVAGTCTSNASDKTCVVNNLTNGVAYTFKVTATNGIGTSALSSASSAVTPSTVPGAPTTVSVVAGDTEVTISFVAPLNNGGSAVTGYKVISSDGTTLTSSSSPLKVTGLTNGTSYTFTVKATNINGDSEASSASSSVTPAKAPDAPSSVSVTEGIGKVSVSWTAPASNGSAITSYTVQAYDNSGSLVAGAICVANAPAVTCDVSTNLLSGNNYTFKVTATNIAGTSSPSTASSEAAIIAAPSVPINVTAVAANARATVSWDAPINSNGSAIIGYTVTAYSSNNIVSGSCVTVAPDRNCEITGLTNGSPYTFKVTATNGIGTSGESLASPAATPSTVPNAPTGLTVAAGDGQVTISFTAPANNGGSPVTGYTIFTSDGPTISGRT
jgi:titin